MGLFGNLFKSIKDPVRGHAQVVSCTAHRGRGAWQNCSMQLVVQAEGVEPTSVRKSDLVRADRWPVPGTTLPVTVDRAHPDRVKIEWDEVESSRDRSERTGEAAAAAMRDIDPALMAAQQGGGPPMVPPQEAVSGSDDDVDDQLARLAKLGKLRDAGVVTPEEFEEQKRQILEG